MHGLIDIEYTEHCPEGFLAEYLIRHLHSRTRFVMIGCEVPHKVGRLTAIFTASNVCSALRTSAESGGDREIWREDEGVGEEGRHAVRHDRKGMGSARGELAPHEEGAICLHGIQ
jgi:hypothetical protein